VSLPAPQSARYGTDPTTHGEVSVIATTNRGLTLRKAFARTGERAQRDLATKITSARESKGGEVNRGIIGTIIGVLVVIILVIVILQLT